MLGGRKEGKEEVGGGGGGGGREREREGGRLDKKVRRKS